jgi:hypothetical protein
MQLLVIQFKIKIFHIGFMLLKSHVTQLDTHSDSVHTGAARWQHQHTDCIYSHYTVELNVNFNNKMI